MELIQAIRVLALALISFLVALGFTPFVAKFLDAFAIKKQVRSQESAPVFFKFHEKKAGTPTMGGLIIWVTTIGLAIIFWLLSTTFHGFWDFFNFIDRKETYLPLATIFIAGLFGLFDDLLGVYRIGPKGGGLSVKQKIFLYLGIALLGAWWFYFKLDFDTLILPFLNYFGGDSSCASGLVWAKSCLHVGIYYIPIFIFMIVASAFSANETDGLDGLLGGVSLFSFGALTVVAFSINRYDLAAFSAVVTGALLAFLWFNIYPARFFMGDTGSMALGITIGVMALLTNTIVLLPFFAIIFVVESLSVIVQMASKKIFKRKIFLSTPIHHHFEALGWHESKITMRFWIISAIFSGLGLVVFFLSKVI